MIFRYIGLVVCIPFIEMCVRMIPPDEVGISTTTANLPSSEEPTTEEPVDSTTAEEEVTTAEVTTAAPVNSKLSNFLI